MILEQNNNIFKNNTDNSRSSIISPSSSPSLSSCENSNSATNSNAINVLNSTTSSKMFDIRNLINRTKNEEDVDDNYNDLDYCDENNEEIFENCSKKIKENFHQLEYNLKTKNNHTESDDLINCKNNKRMEKKIKIENSNLNLLDENIATFSQTELKSIENNDKLTVFKNKLFLSAAAFKLQNHLNSSMLSSNLDRSWSALNKNKFSAYSIDSILSLPSPVSSSNDPSSKQISINDFLDEVKSEKVLVNYESNNNKRKRNDSTASINSNNSASFSPTSTFCSSIKNEMKKYIQVDNNSSFNSDNSKSLIETNELDQEYKD